MLPNVHTPCFNLKQKHSADQYFADSEHFSLSRNTLTWQCSLIIIPGLN